MSINEEIIEMQKQLENIAKQQNSFQVDLNMLAHFFKKKEAVWVGIDDDVKSLEKDFIKKINEMGKSITSSVGKSDVTYIKNLMSDDAKEREAQLLQDVMKLIKKIHGDKK